VRSWAEPFGPIVARRRSLSCGGFIHECYLHHHRRPVDLCQVPSNNGMLTQYIKKHFLLVTIALAVLCVLGWYGVRVGIGLSEFNDTFNVNLARDANTSEYLGEVVSEVKDSRTGKAVSYRIRLNGGRVIERQADSVVVFNP
jgi:hypothetical protein